MKAHVHFICSKYAFHVQHLLKTFRIGPFLCARNGLLSGVSCKHPRWCATKQKRRNRQGLEPGTTKLCKHTYPYIDDLSPQLGIGMQKEEVTTEIIPLLVAEDASRGKQTRPSARKHEPVLAQSAPHGPQGTPRGTSKHEAVIEFLGFGNLGLGFRA